jgi:hypothetical protein
MVQGDDVEMERCETAVWMKIVGNQQKSGSSLPRLGQLNSGCFAFLFSKNMCIYIYN